MSSHPPSPPIPADVLDDLLQDYTVRRLLGHGGMGAVYLAHHTALDREVAIKVMPVELSADASFAKRFEREARSMARLDHPHIVRVYDFGRTPDGHPYFVMEYVDGCDLHHLIQKGRVDVPQALQIVTQVCDALSYAHSMGLVHRDIKPSNVLIDRHGRVKIADFGLARPMEERKAESSALTQSGSVLGTLEYMAPEQLMGKPADHRADIYALGVLLYELLTGDVPRGAWRPPSGVKPMDARLDEVVQRALQPKPEDRYQNAGEVKRDVTSVMEGRPQVPPVRKRKLMWLAVGLAVAVVVGLYLSWSGTQTKIPQTTGPMLPPPELPPTSVPAPSTASPPQATVVASAPRVPESPVMTAPAPPTDTPVAKNNAAGQTASAGTTVAKATMSEMPVTPAAAPAKARELELLGSAISVESSGAWSDAVMVKGTGVEIGPAIGSGLLTLRSKTGGLLDLRSKESARWRVEAQVGAENTSALLITLEDDSGRTRSWRLKPDSFNVGSSRIHTHFLPLKEADFVNATASYGPRLDTPDFDLGRVKELRLESGEGRAHWIILKLGTTGD